MPVPGQNPQQPRSVYDDIADQDVQAQNRQVAQAVATSTGNDPDKVGQAQQLGAQVGVGADVAMDHMDELRKSIVLQQVQERDLASWNPMLARQLSDPNFAAIAHDQVDNLQQTGSLFQRFKDAVAHPIDQVHQEVDDLRGEFAQGKAQYERGMLGIKAKRGEATAEDWERINELTPTASAPISTVTGRVLGGLSSMAGNLLPMAPHSIAVGAAGAGVGAIAGAVATPEGLGIGAVPGAISGFGIGAESEFGAQNYETMAGNAYADMLKRGVDESRAQWAAGAVGAVNTALQLGIMRVAGKPLAGVTGDLFNRALGDTVADAMTQPTTARAIQSAMLQWGKNTAIGTGEMGLQTIVDRVGQDYADKKGLGGTSSDLFSADFGKTLGQSLINAALTMGTINATTGMMGFSANMDRVAKAEQSASFFENLSQNAVDSKVRDRNPDSYQSFIANQAQGTGAENIYLDGKEMANLLNQSGLHPDRIDAELPGLRSQVADAAATGGDVTIPTEQYAARLAGTDLGKAMQAHMRLDPDAMSATEALSFQQKQQEHFAQARQEAEQQTTGNAEFAKSAKVVEGNIYDQLKATKTMPDDVARTNSQFVRDFVVTQAARQGMTPETFFDKYKYTILKGDGGALAQGEPDAASSKFAGEFRAETRGGFDPSSLTALLGQKADASTFLHETAHYFLSVYGAIARDPEGDPSTKEDFGKLLKWFGVKDQAGWDGMSLDEQRQHHEKFAYSYEKYLSEGKAPSLEAQGMFGRFSQWLKRVYKSVRDDINTVYKQQHGTDLPIMTGEVRDVMDRMLASDDQIKQAQAVRSMEPVFKSQDKSGMSDAQWKTYGDMANTATDSASAELGAKSVREMQWMSNAKGRLLRAMQAQHEKLRLDTQAEVRQEMTREEPVYRAQRFLKTGEWEGEETSDAHKMDTEEARKLLPEGQNLGPLSRLFGMTKKGGLHPDDVAAAAGFKDGKEMIDAMLSAQPLKDAVDAETDRRMLDQHGDIATPNGMATAVERAIHNEARARFIAFEMRHAFNMDESERVLVQAARETARKSIEQQKFAELQPSAYAAREAAAARRAIAAQAAGDMEGVGRAKRDQLLQNAMATEALRVKTEADQHLSFLNKFDNPSKAITKAIGADHMDAINELLAAYAMSPRDRFSNRRENMAAWITAEYGRTGIMPAVSDELIDQMGKMHWQDMNIVQLRDLKDAVKSLDYTGRRQMEVMLGEKLQTVDELVEQVKGTLADMKHTPVEDIRARMKYAKGMDKISAQFLNLKFGLKSADAALLKMEQLFQWMDAGKDAGIKEAPVEGPMQRVYRLASKAEATERTMRADATTAMREVHERLAGSKINLSDALDVPELPREGNTRWYRGELISAALNMGNQSNMEKLLMGYGWERENAVSAINRLLSPDEMRFVQGTWDHLATYGDGIRELQRRQTGVSPQMIESTPLVTKHGTFEGGYYPVVYNDVLDDAIAQRQARQADMLFENNYANPSTASGHTITRNGYIGPLFLDLGVISRHIDQVTHDLAWREAVIDMNKILSDQRLTGEVNEVYGREYSKQFRPWLQAMANDKVFNTAGDSAFENSVKKIRSNFTMVGIGFRMSTMAIHGTSALSNSLGELGTKWFAKGAAQFAGVDRFQQARDFMYERSPEMANRMNEADRNIHEAVNEIEKQQDSLTGSTVARKLYDNTRKFAFRGVGILDMASAGPTWMGAYLKGMAHEGDGGLGLGEDAAIAYADRAVRNAHGGGGTKDMAAVQRDKGLMSLMTMFYSYWNHVYNRQRDLGKGWQQAATGQVAVRDFPKLLARSWFYIVIPQIAHTMLAGGGKKNDDDGTLAAFAKEAAEGVGLGFVSGVPILRDLANAAVHGTDYAISPLEKAGQSFVNTFKDVKAVSEGETPKRGFQDTAETLGYATGLPTAQPAATARFLYDVVDGDVKPETVDDWWKGVLTGKVK